MLTTYLQHKHKETSYSCNQASTDKGEDEKSVDDESKGCSRVTSKGKDTSVAKEREF